MHSGLFLVICVALLPRVSCYGYWWSRRANITMLTFNALLFGPFRDERREEIINQLFNTAEPKHEIICLQEIYFDDDTEAIIQAAKNAGYADSLRVPTVQTVCDATRVTELLTPCQVLITPSVNPLVVARCLVDNGFLDGSLTKECISCILTKGVGGFSDCLGATPPKMNPTGLIMITKNPMKHKQNVSFESESIVTTFPRTYLQAHIPGIGQAFCTHLSANLSIFLEDSNNIPYQDYATMNFVETNTLIRATAPFYPSFILGDLNSSPITDVNLPNPGVLQQFWFLFEENNFKTPYFTNNGMCTFCVVNPFVGSGFDRILDHILVPRNCESTVISTERVLDELMTVTLPDNSMTNIPLSDHFGVKLTFEGTITTVWSWDQWGYIERTFIDCKPI